MSDWYRNKFGRQPQARQQYVPFQQQGQPQQPPPGYIPISTPNDGKPPPGATNVHNFWDMMLLWRGGKAHKIDAEPCPQCGSVRYYSRTGEGARRGPPPAPHCFDCGFNGLFDQGMASTWQA